VTASGGGRRLLFLNENIGGHATVHENLRAAFDEMADVHATFLDVPPRGWVRRVAGAAVPGLGRLDLDLQPLRSQLAAAAVARARLGEALSTASPPFDALHVYTQNAGLLSSDLLRERPTVISTDSTNSLNAYRLPYRRPTRFTRHALKLTRLIERRVLSSATLLVANTEWVARSLASYGVPRERIRRLAFGVEIPERIERRPPDGRPVLTWVGYDLERKGGRLLLDLHRDHLRDRCDLQLVTTAPVAAEPGVVVVDDVRPGNGRLAEVLSRTTLFVFPTTIDQAPNVVLEAMAHGVPVVTSRINGIPEMVEDGVSGVLVDPADGAQVLRGVLSLLDDPSRAAALAAAGRDRAVERYDMVKSAAALLDVLDEAVELYRPVVP
jgi:starch synthase